MLDSESKYSAQTLDELNLTLEKVFGGLLKRKSPVVDDTCLQKLLDFIPTIVADTASFEQCGAHSFIQGIIEQGVDVSVLTFGVQLSGYLGKMEEIFIQFHHLYDRLFAHLAAFTDQNFHLSVSTAMFHSLKRLAGHLSGLVWMVTKNDDLEKAFATIKQGQSLFLVAAAKTLILTVLRSIFVLRPSQLAAHPLLEKWLIDTRERILESIEQLALASASKRKDARVPYDTEILSLLCSACSESKAVVSWLGEENVGVGHLLSLITADSIGISGTALKICTKLLEDRQFNGEVGEKLTGLVTDFLEAGESKKALTVCVELLRRNSDEVVSLKLRETFLLPLRDVATELAGEQNPVITKQHLSTLEHTLHCSQRLLGSPAAPKLCAEASPWVLEVLDTLLPKPSTLMESFSLLQAEVMRNKKLLTKVLDFYTIVADRNTIVQQNDANKLLVHIFNVIENCGSNNVIFSKCFECIVKYLPQIITLQHEDRSTVTVGDGAATLTKQYLCHRSWEVRDSVVEFLSDLFTISAENTKVVTWIKCHKLHETAYLSLRDGERYVRGSVLVAMMELIKSPELFADLLLVVGISKAGFLQEICRIIKDDSEEIPRRAAVKLVCSIIRVNLVDEAGLEEAYRVVTAAAHDSDWEVKIAGLEFWGVVIDRELDTAGSQTKTSHDSCMWINVVTRLSEIGCTRSLNTLLDDHDCSVQIKAQEVLTKLRNARHLHGELCTVCRTNSGHEPYKILQKLLGRDFEENEQICDLYSQNPLSLLQDILADSKEMEDNTIDCY